MHELTQAIRRTYKEAGGLPRPLRDDLYGMLVREGVKPVLKILTDFYKIQFESSMSTSEVGELIANLTILSCRYRLIKERGLAAQTKVVYDFSVQPLYLTGKTFKIKERTDEFMLRLNNGNICHPLWLREA